MNAPPTASGSTSRMQLVLYLRASGRDELGTINLWDGVDPPPKA